MKKEKDVKSVVEKPFYLSNKLAVIILILLPIIYFLIFSPGLITGSKMMYGSDWLLGGYPSRVITAQQLAQYKTASMWYSYIFGGLPSFGDNNSLYTLIRLVIPTHIFWTYLFVCGMIIAGLGMFLFLKSLDLSNYTALIGAIAYSFIGNLVSTTYAGHEGRMLSMAFFPLAFFLWNKALTTHRFFWFILAGVLAGFSMTHAHFQLTYYGLWFAFAYLIVQLIWQRHQNKIRKTLKLIGYAIITVLIALGTLAMYFMPLLANLAFEEHRYQSKDKKQIYSQLLKFVKNFVAQQRLVIEAKRKNIDKNKNLLNELENWKINFLATQLRLGFLDSARVSDEEIVDYFKNEFRKDKNNTLIKLKILNLDNLEQVENVLNQISAGKSFDEILMTYGRTDTLVNDNGETDLLPKFYFGALGEIASKLSIKEVYGPISRNGKYSVIEVVEKKEIQDTLEVDFESSKNYIKNYLFLKKFNEATSRQTLRLAEKYGVRVYEDVLKEIKTTSVPMFVHRLMGFGGRIAGVPLLDNWFQFIDIQEFKSKVLP